MNNLISILMPIKNEEKHLKKCIDSILNQSHQSFDLICIDDYSTDSTASILKNYDDPRIRVLTPTKAGVTTGLREAFNISKGEYVTRMDADDLMPKDKLKKLLELIANKPQKSIATGYVEYFSEEFEMKEGYLKYQNWLNSLCDMNNHFDYIYKECVIPAPCWLTRRENLEGAFEDDIIPEDYNLCFKFYKMGLKIFSTKEILHLWRDHSKRVTRSDKRYDINSFYQLKLNYFFNIDYDENKQLILWGSGKKGKNLAKELICRKKEFIWITDSTNKIGKMIYDKPIYSQVKLQELRNYQLLISISSPFAIKEIKKLLLPYDLKLNKDVFYLY